MEAVAEELNVKGLRSRNGQQWTQARAQRVLSNPIYAGTMVIAGVEHRRPNLRIVAQSAFDAARAVRGDTGRRASRSGGDQRRDDAVRSVFGQYDRMLAERAAAGEIPGEDPLGAVLANLEEES